jgi:hypothetical protein
MKFPNAYSRIHHNDEGEVLGWENTYPDEPEYCDDCGGNHNYLDCPMDEYDEDEEDDEDGD